MSSASILIQFLNGLAGTSSLFLVGAGLSIIFGVTRIVNFAHGSLYMLGIYAAYSLEMVLGRTIPGFWLGVLAAAIVTGLIGAAIEFVVLRRIYRAPELFQLLATFGVALLMKDTVLYFWGPEDLLGPRAPGLRGAVDIAGRSFPEYDLVLIVLGPLVLGLLWLLMNRTRWGTLVRAATQDREMVGALGVNQAALFTAVFFLGSLLAGLGGAVQVARSSANLGLDISTVADAFVVVVVGGMGSIPGAFLAAFIISELKAFCIGIGDVTWLGMPIAFSKFTLVAEFAVMALVLTVRPWGLLGRPQAIVRAPAGTAVPLVEPGPGTRLAIYVAVLVLAVLPAFGDAYTLVLFTDIMVFALFAASLHFIMGPGGMISFGHAAYFGLGAYGAGLLMLQAGLPMPLALIGAPLLALFGAALIGWFSVRLSGVYLAMLTLAFAQIAWSIVFQWDGFTGGSNGLIGLWPAEWLSERVNYYYLTLALCGGAILLLWRMIFSPFGFALRAGRDSPLRAEAIGIDVQRQQWFAFVLAGGFAGISGAVYAFSKGSISPDVLGIGRSVDGLVMMLLGGIQTLTGPVIGALAYTWLQDEIVRGTEYWRAILGLVILLLVMAFPQGIVGGIAGLARYRRSRDLS